MTEMYILLAWVFFWAGVSFIIELLLRKKARDRGEKTNKVKYWWRTVISIISIYGMLVALSICKEVNTLNGNSDPSPYYSTKRLGL